MTVTTWIGGADAPFTARMWVGARHELATVSVLKHVIYFASTGVVQDWHDRLPIGTGLVKAGWVLST